MSLTVFGISKSSFQRDQKKIPLLVRTFRSDLSTGFGKQSSYTSRRNFQIRTLLNIFFAPFFQGGLCLNLDGWLFIFQVVAGENGILSIVVLKWKPPKPNFLCVLRLQFFKIFLQVVADGIGILVSDSRKNLSQW